MMTLLLFEASNHVILVPHVLMLGDGRVVFGLDEGLLSCSAGHMYTDVCM